MIKKLSRLFLILGFISGLVLISFIYNNKMRAIERYAEVTFVSPHRAIIFWKTNSQSLGYVKSGETKHQRKNITYQTSSEASEIHAVLLEEIPAAGIYISMHNEDDSPLYFPEIMQIRYDPLNVELGP